jgi:small subunit ribosomal protein S8
MNTTDPVADYLTRIRNAVRARRKRVDVPASSLKREISRILADEKFISGFTEIPDNKQGTIRIALRYANGVSAITGLTRISKPGLRVYGHAEELPRVLNGLGIAIVSTSKGLMTERKAKASNVGGEVLCHVW